MECCYPSYTLLSLEMYHHFRILHKYIHNRIIVKINKCVKDSFVVIGKEGSTSDGENFVQELWDNANLHFEEVKHLAKKELINILKMVEINTQHEVFVIRIEAAYIFPLVCILNLPFEI